MDEIKLTYSEPLIREAIRLYWWKKIGFIFPVVLFLLIVLMVYHIALGDRTWIVGVLGVTIFMGICIMVATYYVHLHHSLKRLKKMKTPKATIKLGEELFCVKSDIGSSEIAWSLITQLWRFEKVWLLFFSEGEFMTLPIEEMPEKSKSFIVSKIKTNGAKIV